MPLATGSGAGLVSLLLGAAAPKAAPPTTTAEERNLSLWAGQATGLALDLQDLTHTLAPAGAPHLPPLVEGPLNYDTTSPVLEPTGKRSRVHAILGPGASLNGVADVVEMIYERVAGRTYPGFGFGLVAVSLAQFLKDVLPSPLASGWEVGLRLPLPIEIDATTPATPKLVLNGDKLLAWSSALPVASRPADADLKRPAAPLTIPVPETLTTAVAATLAGAADPTTLAPGYAAALLVNPYKPVFELIELLQQLRDSDTAAGTAPAASRELAFVLALGAQPGWRKTDGADPLRVVGWTSAGQAVLRRLWLRLGEIDPAVLDAAHRTALTDLKGQLSLALDLSGAGAAGPPDWGPGVRAARAEPPLTPGLRDLGETQAKAYAALGGTWSAPESAHGSHDMILGRYLRVGPIATDNPPWLGPAYVGGMTLEAFWAGHPDTLGSPIAPKTEAARKIIFAIAPNEGKLDASRAADHGLLSTGFQQWTIDNNTELTILLHKFKTIAPYQFDLYFGLHGLDTRVWGGKGAWDGPDATLAPAPGNADETAIKNSNVYWFGAATSELGLAFPTYVTLDRIDNGAARVAMPLDPGYATDHKLADATLVRFHYFGGKRTLNKAGTAVTGVTFDPYWCARVRIASLCSVAYCQAQIMLAVFRMQRMVNEVEPATVNGTRPDQKPKTPARATWTLMELCNSEWGAAVALDQHVNEPGAMLTTAATSKHPKIPPDQQSAVDRTLALPAAAYVQDAAGASTDALDPQWQHRFLVNYLAVRRTFGKAARDTLLERLHDKPLSTLPATAVYPRSDGPAKKAQ